MTLASQQTDAIRARLPVRVAELTGKTTKGTVECALSPIGGLSWLAKGGEKCCRSTMS